MSEPNDELRPNTPMPKITGNVQQDLPMILRNAMSQAMQFRERFMQMFKDRRRDIEKECGYPTTEELDAENYKNLYDRDPIARKVVNILPDATWQVCPEVFEDESKETDSPFEVSWKELPDKLRGGSFFQQEEGRGSVIWEYLSRADRLSGIGHYGVILVGVDYNKGLEEPLEYNNEGFDQKKHELLFLRVLTEDIAEIATYDSDPNSERFGLPEFYTVQLTEQVTPGQTTTTAGITTTTISKRVHWTRIVHIADNLESGEVIGCPRLRPVYNRLYDLHKLYGGSAEMFWVAAFFGLAFETHPELGAEVEIDAEDMKRQMEGFRNSLQRYLSMPGMTVKSIAPQVSDPTPHIAVQIEAICIHLNIPKRIFMGSERGELSSGQDADSWRDEIQNRRFTYAMPKIVVAFIDHLIKIGVLVKPAETYHINWKEEETLTLKEQAEVGLLKTQALVQYLQGSGENLIDPQDFLTRLMGFTEDEAEAILEARMTTMMPEEEEPMMDEFGQPMVGPDGQPIVQPKPGKVIPEAGAKDVDPQLKKQAAIKAAQGKSAALRSDKDREFEAKSNKGNKPKNK